MRPVFFKHFSSLLLHWWPWLKIGFYIFYFLFIQLSNSVESSFARFFVNTLFVIVAIGIIEIGFNCLQHICRSRRYKKAILILGGSYIGLAVIGYYILHGSRNIVATEIWNRQIEASWMTFLASFNQFYWTFFKYAVILFLLKQILLLIRLLEVRGRANVATFPEVKALLSHPSYQTVTSADMDIQDIGSLPIARADQFGRLLDGYRKLKFKAGSVTYMLDIVTIVYLEVHDEITTIYRIDGSHLEVKIPLSKFCEWLPKNRFVRIHDSRAVAIPYIFREVKSHVYMISYEDRPLKLGSQEKYPLYKKWKEYNLLK